MIARPKDVHFAGIFRPLSRREIILRKLDNLDREIDTLRRKLGLKPLALGSRPPNP